MQLELATTGGTQGYPPILHRQGVVSGAAVTVAAPTREKV